MLILYQRKLKVRLYYFNYLYQCHIILTTSEMPLYINNYTNKSSNNTIFISENYFFTVLPGKSLRVYVIIVQSMMLPNKTNDSIFENYFISLYSVTNSCLKFITKGLIVFNSTTSLDYSMSF